MFVQRLITLAQCPREDDHRNAVLPSNTRHTKRRLATQGLGIETTFTSDHQIGAFDRILQADQFSDHVDPGLELRPQKRLRSKPQAACRAATRFVTDVFVQDLSATFGKVPERAIQLLDLLGRCAFLRTENR